jgi:hypothetical protein
MYSKNYSYPRHGLLNTLSESVSSVGPCHYVSSSCTQHRRTRIIIFYFIPPHLMIACSLLRHIPRIKIQGTTRRGSNRPLTHELALQCYIQSPGLLAIISLILDHHIMSVADSNPAPPSGNAGQYRTRPRHALPQTILKKDRL